MDKNIIEIKELQNKLNKKEPVFILDVRPVEQRKEWHIAESIHLDAYERLNNGDLTVLNEVDIPENTPVVTVCAAGRTSLIASEALRKKGIKAYSLQGGMKAWNYAWNSAEVDLANGIKIIQVRRAAKGVLSYVVGSSGEAIVIDASLNPEVYTSLAKQNEWQIKYVMDTHIHADFVSRTRALANATGAKHLLINDAKVDFEFTAVFSGDSIKLGKSHLEFVHTPGHTWESTTLKIEDLAIFTGDTLFVDGIGRPDLKAERKEAIEKAKSLYHSLKQLLSLKPSTLVLPAHASKSISFNDTLIGDTIGEIEKKIPVLNMSEPEFIEYTLSKIPPTPPNYVNITLINKQGSYEGYKLEDLEAGGNHCAIA